MADSEKLISLNNLKVFKSELETEVFAGINTKQDKITEDNKLSTDLIDGLAPVATSGSYEDLNDTPNLAAVATSGDYTDLINTPALADVALSGSYEDLENTPDLQPVATSGQYEDLLGTPTIGDGKLKLYINGTLKSEAFSANTANPVEIDITAADLGLSAAMQFIGVSLRDPQSDEGAYVENHPVWARGEVILFKRSGETFYEEYVNIDGENTRASWELLGDADSYALKSIQITGEDGLTGGGSLSENRVIGLSSDTKARLSKADTALQASDLTKADATITNAENVKSKIGGKGLFAIFESDTSGDMTTTVKEATHAATATTANSADAATNATNVTGSVGGRILGDIFISSSSSTVKEAAHASAADIATAATTATNLSAEGKIGEHTVSEIIASDGTTVREALHAESATAVTTTIGRHTINEIFKEDGVTVLNADHAARATLADSATTAESTPQAAHATTADAATSASEVTTKIAGNNIVNIFESADGVTSTVVKEATHAVNADLVAHATTADTATSATTATTATTANAVAGTGKLGTTSGTTEKTDRQPDHIFETNSNTVKRASTLTYYSTSNVDPTTGETFPSKWAYTTPLHIVKCTADAYSSMAKDSNTLYIIVG